MHEIGSRVVTHAATMECQCSVPHLRSGYPGHSYINGHSLHVKAVNGYAVPVSSEEFVAPGRAVAADNVNLKIGISERGHQVVQKVEHARIVLVNLSGAMVPQVIVQARQRILVIT